MTRVFLLLGVAAGALLAPAAASAQVVDVNARVRLVYLVPLDGIDRGLDVGRIPEARDALQHWLAGKVPRRLRVDEAVAVVRSSYTRDEVAAASGSTIMAWVAHDLFAAGLWTTADRFGVYWDGPGPSCGSGGAVWSGGIGVVFLESCVPGVHDPEAYPLVMLHEVIHSLGGVMSPTAKGMHVTDDPRDLMWPAIPPPDPTLDNDRRDYVGHGDPLRFDLLASALFEPVAAWCESPDPFVALGRGTCCQGGWLPPGMTCPRPVASVAPPASTPAPPAPSSCAIPDPFTAFGGGICCNGGWIMANMTCVSSTPPPTLPPPTLPPAPPVPPTSTATCSGSDPFLAMGGGICCGGGWLAPGMTCVIGAPSGPSLPAPPPPTPTGDCLTVKPGPLWTCVHGGWLPPGYPSGGQP